MIILVHMLQVQQVQGVRQVQRVRQVRQVQQVLQVTVHTAPAPIILINIDYNNGNADDLTSLLQNVTSNVQPKYSYLPPSKPLYHDSGHGGYSGGYSPGWLPLS